jgi:hypothetical protein
MIKSIPKPPTHEKNQTISSMKNFVDKQELRIQINMMEIDELEPLPLSQFAKKCSTQTQDNEDSWEERPLSEEDAGEWGWQDHLHYQESIQHDFPSFLD